MNCYVVVEGELDGKLMERTLHAEVSGFKANLQQARSKNQTSPSKEFRSGSVEATKSKGLRQWPRDAIRIVVAGGSSAATSAARSLLAARRGPVAILLDADAYNPMAVTERREGIEETLGQFGRADNFRGDRCGGGRSVRFVARTVRARACELQSQELSQGAGKMPCSV